MTKQKKEDPLFVAVKNPKEIHRSLLESYKDLLVVLQKVDTITTIRDEKVTKVQELSTLCRNIKTQLNTLKRVLPAVIEPPKKEVPKKVAKPKEEVKKSEEVVVSKPKTEVQRIEDELAYIESKLQNLS